MKLNTMSLAGAVLAAGALSACAPRGYYYASYGAPPPPPAVAYRAAPGPGYVWTDGYYDRRGSGWYWVEGRYMRPPRPHAVWVAPRWRQSGHRWEFRQGYWR